MFGDLPNTDKTDESTDNSQIYSMRKRMTSFISYFGTI